MDTNKLNSTENRNSISLLLHDQDNQKNKSHHHGIQYNSNGKSNDLKLLWNPRKKNYRIAVFEQTVQREKFLRFLNVFISTKKFAWKRRQLIPVEYSNEGKQPTIWQPMISLVAFLRTSKNCILFHLCYVFIPAVNFLPCHLSTKRRVLYDRRKWGVIRTTICFARNNDETTHLSHAIYICMTENGASTSM